MSEQKLFYISMFFYVAVIVMWYLSNKKNNLKMKCVCLSILLVLNIIGIIISFCYSNGSFDTIPFAISFASTMCMGIELRVIWKQKKQL